FKEAVNAVTINNLEKLKDHSGIFKANDQYLVNYPINIKLANRQWSLIIEVPAELALAGPQALSQNMQQTAQSLGV
ncbi:hypothetical protein, partial [Escherichia coli]